MKTITWLLNNSIIIETKRFGQKTTSKDHVFELDAILTCYAIFT